MLVLLSLSLIGAVAGRVLFVGRLMELTIPFVFLWFAAIWTSFTILSIDSVVFPDTLVYLLLKAAYSSSSSFLFLVLACAAQILPFIWFFLSIIFHVLSDIHPFFLLFSNPSVLSRMSWSMVFILSHFSSTPSDASYLKKDAPSLNFVLSMVWHSVSSNFIKLYFVLFEVFLLTFCALILRIPVIIWWSDPISASLLLLTSKSNLLQFRLMDMWSVWFSASLSFSGDTHVIL